ncbi:WW domain-binding protein 2-like isoform X1 [Heterodontus francisci]|uniref:WW domain-binding protein 2-like isoform X1 n=1 Tax=Heterodontus francisci TaxID=7792 RepID=UPI00355B0F65
MEDKEPFASIQQHSRSKFRARSITMMSCVLLSFNNVQLTFQDMKTTPEAFKGKKKGKVCLTQERVIFIPKDQSKPMKSFSMPFRFMENCSVEQGIFTANYIKCKINAQPAGGWEGTASFKLTFYSGGAIDFGKAMIQIATHASRGPSAYSPVIYVETISIVPTRRANYYRSSAPYIEQSQPTQFAYIPGPPPPAGGYYAPVPPMYSPYGSPPPSYFGSTQPPLNFAAAGTPAYFGNAQPPPMISAAGMPAGFHPSAPPMSNNFSSPLTSPEQPIPSTAAAGAPSYFNPSISSMPNYYTSPLSSNLEWASQSTIAPKTPGKSTPKS